MLRVVTITVAGSLLVGCATEPNPSSLLTVHGYVLDASGSRIAGARVRAYHFAVTDRAWMPGQPHDVTQVLAETRTNSGGNFVLSVDEPRVNSIQALYDEQSGTAQSPFIGQVRIVLRRHKHRT
jgi:hypothetical protein